MMCYFFIVCATLFIPDYAGKNVFNKTDFAFCQRKRVKHFAGFLLFFK